METTYQAGRVQASAERARVKFQSYYYFGHFLLYSHFAMYRLWQTGYVPAQLNREPAYPIPKRGNRVFQTLYLKKRASDGLLRTL
jgi:hypothetical protein